MEVDEKTNLKQAAIFDFYAWQDAKGIEKKPKFDNDEESNQDTAYLLVKHRMQQDYVLPIGDSMGNEGSVTIHMSDKINVVGPWQLLEKFDANQVKDTQT